MAPSPRLAAFEARIRFLKAPARNATADTGAIAGLVGEILADVRGRGDAAVREYARRFDKVEVDALEVTAPERRAAVDGLERQTRADTEFAIERVRAFAQALACCTDPESGRSSPIPVWGQAVRT